MFVLPFIIFTDLNDYACLPGMTPTRDHSVGCILYIAWGKSLSFVEQRSHCDLEDLCFHVNQEHCSEIFLLSLPLLALDDKLPWLCKKCLGGFLCLPLLIELGKDT